MGLSSVLSLGPLRLPAWLLVTAVSVVLGLLAAGFRLRRHRRLRRATTDYLTGLLMFFLLGWKLAPALFHPAALLRDPLPLLMAPGGASGVVVGAVAAAAWGALSVARRRRLLRFAPASIGVFALTMTAGLGLSAVVARIASPAPAAAPEIVLTSTEGKTLTLSSLRGSVVVVNFWATWCPPCRAEIPELQRFHEDPGVEGALIVSVNMTDTEPAVERVESFARERGVGYPVLLDLRGEAAREYAVTVVPTTVVLTPAGLISATRTGAVDAAWLRRAARAAAR